MRDLLITALVFGSLPFILKRPYIGVLVWAWLSYMNPHRLAWGFAYSMPFAQIVAITLLVSIFFTKENLKIPWNSTLVVWISFIFWMFLTTVFAIYPDWATDYLIEVLKIQLITLLTLILMNNMRKINLLIWVIVISIGFFSVKGGAFTILSGGAHRVYGPTSSFIQENNALALATLMIIPLMVYLYNLHRENKWIRLALAVSIILSAVSVIGSQSRGAVISITAVGVFFWLKSKGKLFSAIAVIVAGVAFLSFMPQNWHERMQTITNYEQDASAMGRINAWLYSLNVANDRFTGAGFQSWTEDTFATWAPDPSNVKVAHSIYFGVLADHGWVGLAMFLSILAFTWLSLSRTIRKTKELTTLEDVNLLCKMLQVSLVAYLSGGAFLSLSYFDLPWHIIAISLLLSCRFEQSDFQCTDAYSGRKAGKRTVIRSGLASSLAKRSI